MMWSRMNPKWRPRGAAKRSFRSPSEDRPLLEPVVDAKAQHARLEAVAGAGERIGPVGEIDVEILDPRRPGRGERDLHAAAYCPPGVGLALGQAADLGVAAADGKTAA